MKFVLPSLNLEDEISKTELKEEQVNTIKDFSRIGTIYDFAEFAEKNQMYPFGISNHKGVATRIIARLLGLKEWADIFEPYKYVMRSWDSGLTEHFINHTFKEKASIAFFLPPLMYTTLKDDYCITRHEAELLIKNPNELVRDYFIVGLYNLINKEVFNEIKKYFNHPKCRYDTPLWVTGIIIKDYKKYLEPIELSEALDEINKEYQIIV